MTTNYFNKISLDLSIARDNVEYYIKSHSLWSSKSPLGDEGNFYLKIESDNPSSDSIYVNNDLNITSTTKPIERIYVSNTAQTGKHIDLYYSNFIEYNSLKSLPSSSSSSGGSSSATTFKFIPATVTIPTGSTYTKIFDENSNRVSILICGAGSVEGVSLRRDPSVDLGINNQGTYMPNGYEFDLIDDYKTFRYVLEGTEAVYAKIINSSTSTIGSGEYFALEEVNTTEGAGTSNIQFKSFGSGILFEGSAGSREKIVNNYNKVGQILLRVQSLGSGHVIDIYDSYTGGNKVTSFSANGYYIHDGKGPLYAISGRSATSGCYLYTYLIINK